MQKPLEKDLIFAGFDISVRVSYLIFKHENFKLIVNTHILSYSIAINFHNTHPQHQLSHFEEATKLSNKMASKIPPFLIMAIFSAILGMFQFGFNTGVINAPQVSYF